MPSRKALAAEFAWEGRRLFVIVCHLKSMRSQVRREADYAKKQRHVQAEIVQGFAADLLACDPQAVVVVLGDLNDIPGSKTLKLLKGKLFHNLLDDLPPSTLLYPSPWSSAPGAGSYSGQSCVAAWRDRTNPAFA